MPGSQQLTVYFDYRCPFCYRLVTLLTHTAEKRADVTLYWRHFSLEQLNAPDPDWQLWEQPLEYELVEEGPFAMRMLRSFLASYAAARQGPEPFARFRQRMFAAKHDARQEMSRPEVILDAARQAQLDMAVFEQEWQSPAGRQQLRADHLSGEALGVAGLPALVVDDRPPLYIRLAAHPPEAERDPFFDELLQLTTRRPYLRTFRYVGD